MKEKTNKSGIILGLVDLILCLYYLLDQLISFGSISNFLYAIFLAGIFLYYAILAFACKNRLPILIGIILHLIAEVFLALIRYRNYIYFDQVYGYDLGIDFNAKILTMLYHYILWSVALLILLVLTIIMMKHEKSRRRKHPSWSKSCG